MEPHPKRILVLDDEPMVAKALGRVLRKHDITISEEVDHALDLLGERTFDLVFCDLMMPNKSGMDFFAEVEKRFPDTTHRIIFMTGGAYTDSAQSFMAKIDNPIISKPFDVYQIRELVKQS